MVQETSLVVFLDGAEGYFVREFDPEKYEHTMIISLGAVFDIPVSKSAAQAILKSLAGAAGGRFISQVLVGWIPGFGNAINATTAAGITEKIGWKAAEKFDREARQRITA